MILIGATTHEIDFTRNILKNRWPYPSSRDEELILDDKNKAWLFKLKRHPWAISYGHKHIDRAVELAQSLLHKAIAPPKNTDADSGKSIIIFLLRVCTKKVLPRGNCNPYYYLETRNFGTPLGQYSCSTLASLIIV